MTTVKIMINDREGLEKIAADPDVQIRIKNALIDGVSKRVAKAFNKGIEQSIDSAVKDIMHPKRANELFQHTYDWQSVKLTNNFTKTIEQHVMDVIRAKIAESVEEIDLVAELNSLVENKIKRIQAYDFEKRIDAFIEKKLASVFVKKFSSEA